MALAAALTFALSGCGSVVVGTRAPAEARSAGAVRADLNRLYHFTWGPPQARQASEVLSYVGFQQRVGKCLAERGYGYTPGPFLDATSANPPPLDWYPALLPVDAAEGGERGFSRPTATAVEVRPTKRWPGQAPSPDVQMACEEQAQGTPPPALNPELDEKLSRLVGERVDSTASTDPRRYVACMRSKGQIVRGDRVDFVQSFVEARPVGGGVSAEERRAAVADAVCRATAHADVMANLDAPLRTFAQDNGDQLARSADRLQALTSQAQRAAASIGLNIDWL